jgi:hypothetical protein
VASVSTVSVGVQNLSSVVSSDDLAAAFESLTKQVHEHFRSRWPDKPGVYLHEIDQVLGFAPDDWCAFIVDDKAAAVCSGLDAPDSDGVGWHWVDVDGCPFMVVLAATSNASPEAHGHWTWTFSHELLEMLANPYIGYVEIANSDERYWAEVCDPVEGHRGSYVLDGTRVCNFVTPSWFQTQGEHPFDHLEILHAPFTTGPGGSNNLV